DLARALGEEEGKATLAVGDTMTLPGRQGQVAGIVPSTTGLPTWEVWLGRKVLKEVTGKRGGRNRRFLQVRGLDDPLISGAVHNRDVYPTDDGRWFDKTAGVKGLPNGESAIQAVLGEGIARELGRDLGRPSLRVGDVIDVGVRKWVVVGILKSAGT